MRNRREELEIHSTSFHSFLHKRYDLNYSLSPVMGLIVGLTGICSHDWQPVFEKDNKKFRCLK